MSLFLQDYIYMPPDCQWWFFSSNLPEKWIIEENQIRMKSHHFDI